MARLWLGLGACVLLGVVVIAISGNGQAATPEEIADAQKKVLEIADDIANKKTDDAQKKAKAYVKDLTNYKDLEAAMKTMALRDNGGVGFGPKDSPFSPDGIEAKLIKLATTPALKEKQLNDQADALAKSANIISAVAEMSLAKPPKNNVEKWNKYAQAVKDASAELSDAVANKNADKIKTASEKLNQNCTYCHSIFKNK